MTETKKCPACAEEILFDAKKCKHCGTDIMPEVSTKDTLNGLAVLFVIVMIVYFGFCGTGDTTPKPEPPPTRKEIVESQFSKWDGSHRGLVNHIKSNLNDAKSFEHVETKFRDDGDKITVVMKYRANNLFGGKVLSTTIAEVDLNQRVLRIIE